MKLNKGVLFILLGASFFGFTPIFPKLGFSYGATHLAKLISFKW